MKYIHPDDHAICAFAEQISDKQSNLKTVCVNLLKWFDSNITYSRLNAPFYPLQRSDLDVLSMKCGTCGDYSNLVVAVLTALGYETQYAYVHRDCYGDEQDHICAAVKEKGRWILIDATQPYRKWYGFDCPHLEFDLLSPVAFELKMKTEEDYWTAIAKEWGNPRIAGLLYAPWIHSERIKESTGRLDSVFFLLTFDGKRKPVLNAYYQCYTQHHASLLAMASLTESGQAFRFSIYDRNSLWDGAQWGEAYTEDDVPKKYVTGDFEMFRSSISRISVCVDAILNHIS